MSYGWAPYISVAKRHANAKKHMDKLRKQGKKIQPIEIAGNKIAKSFWGKAWCSHLEKFSDYANRLPRGRTYARNGSICHLAIKKGHIEAMVSGSEIYNIEIQIKPLAKQHWQSIRQQCAGSIGSLLELLQGKLSDNVMQTVTDANSGLFPQPEEITFNCDCPDWAGMCKHTAAALYGIGARLDQEPELLFLLRDVDHMVLIDSEMSLPPDSRQNTQLHGDLGDIFGIDLTDELVVGDVVDVPLPPKNKTRPKISLAKDLLALRHSAKFANKPKTTTLTATPLKAKPGGKIQATGAPSINISHGIKALHIKKLRKKFGMSAPEFAKLIGKQTITIRNWEAKKGILNLQAASQKALVQAFHMDKKTAWARLSEISLH